MKIEFYIPMLSIEFFTWLAVYIQFGLIATLFMSFGVHTKDNTGIVKQVLLGSAVLAPSLLYIFITDYKGFKQYFYQEWIETPAQARKRWRI